MALFHFGNLLFIIMDTLSAGGDLQSMQEQIIAERIARILRIIHRVERPFDRRIMGHKHQRRTGFREKMLSQPFFFLRRKVYRIGDLFATGLGVELLGIGKTDLRDLYGFQVRQPLALSQHQIQFVRIFPVQQIEDGDKHARFQLHQVLKAVDKAHFQIHALKLCQMARCVGILAAEHRPDGKDLFKDADHRLLVLLRTLIQIRALVEIFDHEHIRAALGTAHDQLRRHELHEALFPQETTKAVHHAVRDTHDRADAWVTQGDHPVVEHRIQLQIFDLAVIGNFKRQTADRAADLRNGFHSDVEAQRTPRIGGDPAVEKHPVLRLDIVNIKGRFSCFPDALEYASRASDIDKGELAHILDVMDRAFHTYRVTVPQRPLFKLLDDDFDVACISRLL